MKTYKILLPLGISLLMMLAVLGVLGQGSEVAAGVLREWDGNWYWKDGGWIDYAPSGVPDFDQKQDNWDNHQGSQNWTYCGPVAAANSLWWFDSKFEPNPVGPPGGPPATIPNNDNYYLVTSYLPGLDDHDPQNVGGMGLLGLVDNLACYFDTDGSRTGGGHHGTEVHDMAYGLQQYLYNDPTHPCYSSGRSNSGSYYDDYHVQLVKMPAWEWVVEEVERSEDVILLLGFWQETAPGNEEWIRLGGHYVTVAGINSANLQIAFSDPFIDNAEAGGLGRVLNGTILPHTPAGHPFSEHNDAGNISHDSYNITTMVNSPHGEWEILDYVNPDPAVPLPGLTRQNHPNEYTDQEGDQSPTGSPIYVEVEYAIAMSPFKWKPGGEWVDTWWNEQWITEWWWYEDDGHSCLPDFWWLNDAWEGDMYDGPVAVANSFWWFDSKAETLKTGGFPTAPPAVSDHYRLVESYGDWDDHAISNTVPFIKDMGTNYLDTGPAGTGIVNMTTGINAYLAASGVAGDFYTKTQESPTFEWVADEVETCEDVIMLLGFYEKVSAEWERKGGHWVNAAGVSRDNNLIGLSDPYIDHAINSSISSTLYLGRVFPPERLDDPFSEEEKKSPQAISHDIYSTTITTIPAGQWGLVDYPVTSVLTDFIGMNGGGVAVDDWEHSFATVVEWAIGVSPYSDLIITKTAMVTEITPGDRITYTLEYANAGLAAAVSITITDILNLEALTNITYTANPPLLATQGLTYVWTLPKLSYGQSGFITITADSVPPIVPTNTAYITGLNEIDNPTPDGNPDDNTSSTGSTSPLPTYLPVILKNS